MTESESRPQRHIARLRDLCRGPDSPFKQPALLAALEIWGYEGHPDDTAPAERIRTRIVELEAEYEPGMYGMEHHLDGMREALALLTPEEG